jgi:hypothetical protein
LPFEQPSKVVAEIGTKIIKRQVCAETGEKLNIVASCGASGQYVPLIKVKKIASNERADLHGSR